MTRDELRVHLLLLRAATRDDLDELLTDLLCQAYPSKTVQNS